MWNLSKKGEFKYFYISKIKEETILHYDLNNNKKLLSKNIIANSLSKFCIYEKFFVNQKNDGDNSAFYLVKWKVKNFAKYTLESSFFIENLINLKDTKIKEFNSYKNSIKDFKKDINFKEINIQIDDFKNRLNINLEDFIKSFQNSNLFIPIDDELDCINFRDLLIDLVNELFKKKV